MRTRANSKLVELHVLFEISRGNKFDLNKMEQCEPADDAIAFAGRSGEKNGIVGFVRRYGDIDPYEAGQITVALGGAALSSFVQPRAFYTGQNIDVLKPRTEMALDVKLYYCVCVEANRFRYSTFGREANRTLKNLLVPDLDLIPPWVNGITTEAVAELRRDLNLVI
ncbi:MAG: restriction endonuclease subunit S [Planctomycetes bacterium]|nr:restriction endonuclease subunit S [Planctomycetota bacterium]